MHIVLYERGGNAPFEAIAAGCHAAGHRVTWQRPGVWTPADVLTGVDYVFVKGLHGNAAPIREAYQARGVPVWITDLPRLREEAGAIGVFRDTVHWLPSYRVRSVVAPDALTGRRDASGGTILVIGQKPDDRAHGMEPAAMDRWARETIAALRAVDSRPIIYRPHPRDRRDMARDAFGADDVSTPGVMSLRDALADAAVVVVYNSTVGWDAIAAGVPVIALAPREKCAYAEYVSDTISEALIPGTLLTATRADALGRAASTQWTLDELRSGHAIRVMLEEGYATSFDAAPSDADDHIAGFMEIDPASEVAGVVVKDEPLAGAGEAIQLPPQGESPALPPVAVSPVAPVAPVAPTTSLPQGKHSRRHRRSHR